jgi:hypothetical protein
MDQKNRLLREAHYLLRLIATGVIRPLASKEERERVTTLQDRIAKNLKITVA